MQLKFFLYSVAFVSVASSSFAQQSSMHAKADSARHTIAPGKPGQLLASNTPVSTNSTAPGKKGKYAPIPLAGAKSYFGEKNDYVTDYVRRYLELHYNSLGSVQNRSATPFSVIDNELEKKHMPKELKYIPVIESALNYNAVSSAGAVGPWQLMKETARMLGLSVSGKHDERRDIYKSTEAATSYLEMLYSELNDWLLVIAAYNSGPIPVERAIERTGSRNFWDIKQYLPRETQGYVLAFIATASIFEKLNKFISLGSIPIDFKFGKDDEPAPIPTGVASTPGQPGVPAVRKSQFTDEELRSMCIVRIDEPLYLDLLVQELGMDKKQLLRWNTDYDKFVFKTYPTPFYNFRLPKDKLDLFLKKKDMLTRKSKEIFATMK